MLWEFIKEHNIISALITGAFGFFSILAGVAWATRKSIIIKRAKFETKERMKIENNKEIIEAIKSFPFVVVQARYKTTKTAQNILSKLPRTSEGFVAWGVIEAKDLDIGSGENSLESEYIKIENLIFILEYDLKINGEDSEIRSGINKIEIMLEKMKLDLDFDTGEKICDDSIKELQEIVSNYSDEKDGSRIEAKRISDKLTVIYLQRLNQ